MMAELNMCFKTSESILMWHQYQIMLENGRLVSISKSEYSHYVDGKFWEKSSYFVSKLEEIQDAFYHLAKSDVDGFKKLYNILYEYDYNNFKIAEEVLKKIQHEYAEIFELPF